MHDGVSFISGRNHAGRYLRFFAIVSMLGIYDFRTSKHARIYAFRLSLYIVLTSFFVCFLLCLFFYLFLPCIAFLHKGGC